MKDNIIIVNNQELKVILTFEHNGKNFVVYRINENEVSASIFKYDQNNHLILEKITLDEDWDMVSKVVNGGDEHE